MPWKFWPRKSRNTDLDDEIAHDLAAETEENLRAGMSREDATRRSRKEFGNVPLVKEATRETWDWTSIERLIQDLRYAFRQLARSPGFALIAILSLGLGIGANTSIFTLINVMMLKSLPVSHPEELVAVTLSSRDGKGWGSLTHRIWEQLRDQPDLFNGSFAYAATRVELNLGGDARAVPLGLVSGGFFPTLGFHAALGRVPTNTDDKPGCPAIAAISNSFWQSEFGGSPSALGKFVLLNGHTFEIVGVTEPGFFGIEYGFQVPVWAPLCTEATLFGNAAANNSSMSRVVMGRLPRGVSADQLQARVAALTPAILEATIPPNATADAIARYRASRFGVLPFPKGIPDLSRNFGQPLLILMAVVGVVLLIACANIANLLLARATARQREIAVRLSLGASRARLLRQLLTESMLLALLGAGAAILFAAWGSRILLGLMTPPDRVVLDLTPDPSVLAFTLAAGIFTGVLFGLAPSWRAVRVDLHVAMKLGSRAATQVTARFNAGKILVAAQVALSLLLLVGAGLLLGSWRRLVTIDTGFRSDHVLLIGANLRTAQMAAEQRGLLYRRALDRLRAVPGIESASAAARTPIGNVTWHTTIEVDGSSPAASNSVRAQLNEVSEDYFATIGTTLLAGRDFSITDRSTTPLVGIVSEEVARKLFRDPAAALGRSIHARAGTRVDPPLQIIGIVTNTKDQSLRDPSPPQVYFALGQDIQPGVSFNFVIRTAGPPAAIASAAKAAIAEVEPRFSLSVTTLEQQIGESVRLPRSVGLLTGFFSALALLLASIGLYGVMSYAVARRRTEIGIRIALGAERTRVIGMVLGDVARIVAAGIAIGLIAALMLTRLAAGLLFGVAPNDPLILTMSALTLITVALCAAIIPARRAANLDPMTALRED